MYASFPVSIFPTFRRQFCKHPNLYPSEGGQWAHLPQASARFPSSSANIQIQFCILQEGDNVVFQFHQLICRKLLRKFASSSANIQIQFCILQEGDNVVFQFHQLICRKLLQNFTSSSANMQIQFCILQEGDNVVFQFHQLICRKLLQNFTSSSANMQIQFCILQEGGQRGLSISFPDIWSNVISDLNRSVAESPVQSPGVRVVRVWSRDHLQSVSAISAGPVQLWSLSRSKKIYHRQVMDMMIRCCIDCIDRWWMVMVFSGFLAQKTRQQWGVAGLLWVDTSPILLYWTTGFESCKRYVFRCRWSKTISLWLKIDRLPWKFMVYLHFFIIIFRNFLYQNCH